MGLYHNLPCAALEETSCGFRPDKLRTAWLKKERARHQSAHRNPFWINYFTLLDLLIVVAVIAVLIMMQESILGYPGLSVYEASETNIHAPRGNLSSTGRPSMAFFKTTKPAGGVCRWL